jgi:hypothetical protein
MKKKLKNLISWLRPKPKEIVCGCGHTSKMEKEVHVGKKKETLKILYRPNRTPPYCLDCVEKMAVICPWCKRPIYIGDYITLYTPTDPNFKIPEGAVVYTKDPLRLVGCQRSDCAETGADYCGIWEAPGKVKRIPSAIERVMMTGRPVVMNF